MLHFFDLIQITQGKVLQMADSARPVKSLITDSRKATGISDAIFIAIQGEQHDGHLFVNQLLEAGVSQFLVSIPPKNPEKFAQANVLQVADTKLALQQIAIHHRKQFPIPVIGITGSNGKTIVKEWLSQMLAPYYSIVKNPKSYNSQIGVPLSVWQINDGHNLGIFEAGISLPGEMEKLEKIIAPTVGIFTNLGSAHDEGFINRQQKAVEKASLFEHCVEVVYCCDYPEIHDALKVQAGANLNKKLLAWSKEIIPEAFANQLAIVKDTATLQTNIKIQYQPVIEEKESTSFLLPFTDDASIENCMHCIVYMLYHRFSVEKIQAGLDKLRKVSMRMELKQGINQTYLVDDSYSNDLSGLQIALDFLVQQKKSNRYTVILSDMLQTGMTASVLYAEVARLLSQKNIGRLVAIGHEISEHQALFQQQKGFSSEFYSTTSEFLKSTVSTSFHNEVILIKGARKFGFEQIVRLLQQKIHGTTLEINMDALTHNLNFYRSKLKPETKIMVMVKAFSYGGASFEIANLLQFHQVDYLGVAYVDEGIMLRENGIQLPVLILNPSVESFGKTIQFNLEPEIYSLELLQEYVKAIAATEKEITIPGIHLKIDTGMHRLGFAEAEISELITFLVQQPAVKVNSIFSHLAASDEAMHQEFTLHQVQLYEHIYQKISESLGYQPIRHILNSAGIIRYPTYQFEMVRLGIGLYGVESGQQEQNALENVGTLRTVISQIKLITAGETVGYSRKGVVNHPTRIATIAIGYADGFDRRFGNGQIQVIIGGKKAPTIGNICMDMCMIDITQIPEAQEGDEVILFGKELPVTELASAIGTIPYEILTGIGERVKRVYFAE